MPDGALLALLLQPRRNDYVSYVTRKLREQSIGCLGGDATYYTWTADGAMATKQEVAGWTYYTWDVDESLTQIAAPNVTLDNRYNARMQRVRREEDSEPSNLIYDAQKLIAEATEEGLTRYYLSEGGSVYSPLVSQLGSQHWQLFDALGTVLGLTAGDGGQTDTFLYEAFGTSLGRTGPTATPYQYVGGYGYFNEPSVGLEQVWWRWLGRGGAHWLSREPQPGHRAEYDYVAGAPSMMVDPWGLQGHYPAMALYCIVTAEDSTLPEFDPEHFNPGYDPTDPLGCRTTVCSGGPQEPADIAPFPSELPPVRQMDPITGPNVIEFRCYKFRPAPCPPRVNIHCTDGSTAPQQPPQPPIPWGPFAKWWPPRIPAPPWIFYPPPHWPPWW